MAERNTRFSLDLFKDLGIERPNVLDVGCGTGTLVAAAQSLGGGGVGFDLDAASCAHGAKMGLDLRAECWHADIPIPEVNLITCISVLEHLHQPRPLLEELIKASNGRNCPLFVSVTFFTEDWWHYIHEPFGEGFHPFKPPRIHVSHFSPAGFELAAQQLGARRLQPMMRRMGWNGYWVNG